LVAQGTLGTK
jgi:hypothetical protein